MVNNYPTPRVEPKDKGSYCVFTINEVAYHFTISYGMYVYETVMQCNATSCQYMENNTHLLL